MADELSLKQSIHCPGSRHVAASLPMQGLEEDWFQGRAINVSEIIGGGQLQRRLRAKILPEHSVQPPQPDKQHGDGSPSTCPSLVANPGRPQIIVSPVLEHRGAGLHELSSCHLEMPSGTQAPAASASGQLHSCHL